MKPLAPNSLIQNRYLIVHLIGKGGMGEVYLAVDQRLGSAVALKRTFFADDEMLGGAFEREARTLARLRHPVLPKVSDHFTENGEQYLVMEHIAGDDLAKRLEGAQKPFPLSWVLFWADQLLDALAYLHTHEPPIIHRDIKPQNLKLTDENHIVLLDFGLSKNTGQTKISGSSSSGSTGSVVGYTPHYAPMEQIRGTGTNPRSDIYSLSATLYQLMSNTVPADALTRADALLNGDADPIKPLDQVNPEVPAEVSEVILHGMEVSQERRFSNAKEMQKALRKAFSQMQEAMSAQTIAFATPEKHSSRIEQPAGAMNSIPAEKTEDADSQATQLRDDQVAAEPVPIASVPKSQDATVQYTGPIDGAVRQADVKTEVYNTGSNPLYTPSEPAPATHDSVPATPIVREDWSVPADNQNGGFAPDATVANMDFEAVTPASPYSGNEPFSSSGVETADAYATRVPSQSPESPIQSQPRPVAQTAPKKKSKAVWAVGALVVLFFVGIVAAGAGWFVYSKYYASAAPAPTPSPEPTLEITPTPEPTFEAVTNSNSNTSTAQVETNSNANTNTEIPTVEPTPSRTETATREPDQPSKPTQQVESRKTTPVKTITPVAAKPTPKKSDRTVILQ